MSAAPPATGYCTRNHADQWFAARHVTRWPLAAGDARDGALVRAADWLDGQYRFRGVPRDPAQPRVWPRRDAGQLSDTHLLPPPVMQAYLELALLLLDGEADAATALGMTGAVTAEQMAGVSVRYDRPRAGLRRHSNRIDALLAPYLETALTTRLVRL